MLNSLLGVGGGRCQKEEKEEEEGKTEEEEEEEGSCSADNAKEGDRPLHFPFTLQLRKNYGGNNNIVNMGHLFLLLLLGLASVTVVEALPDIIKIGESRHEDKCFRCRRSQKDVFSHTRLCMQKTRTVLVRLLCGGGSAKQK